MAKQSSGSRGRPKSVDAAVVDEYWCPDGFQEEYGLTENDLALCNRRLHDPLALDPRRILSYFGAEARPDWDRIAATNSGVTDPPLFPKLLRT